MSQTAETLTEAPHEPAVTPAPLARTRPFYWSVRRELWENPAIVSGPVVVCGLSLLGFGLSTIGLAARRAQTLTLDPIQQAAIIGAPYRIVAAVVLLTMLLVGLFYSLGALQGERRDRSILFWKSLPVSDRTTVLAKAAVPLLVLPAITFVLVPLTQALMYLWSTLLLLLGGVSIVALLASWGDQVVLLYGLAILSLWFAPVYAWLLLLSAWARRNAFLWAVLPPIAVSILERSTFGTNYVGTILQTRLMGGYETAFTRPDPQALAASYGVPDTRLAELDPIRFLSTPGLWLGLLAAAVLLATTTWLRQRREP